MTSALSHWKDDDLRRFLEVRQEFFLDPMGSNKERFIEAAKLLQQALFDWYTKAPGKFEGMLSLVTAHADAWSRLRKDERRTLMQRRFALNNAFADTPAVESSVSENQWQRIFGSLGLGLSDPGTFDRFLVQLDEETNPSLRINHRYVGELLPHDNMVSYLSSMTATFLNENAIIGKVSPCVTHMEEAAMHWLLTLVGWDGLLAIHKDAATLPLQRLPTAPEPNQHPQRWLRDEPTGTIVAGGTIANISALLIARNAVFDYLLGWDGAVQMLGPAAAWQAVHAAWGYQRLVVLTSLGAHFSIEKSALQAGIGPANVIKIKGSKNPWILDKKAFAAELQKRSKCPTDLVVAVVLIAGKTETGYVDHIKDIAELLDDSARSWKDGTALPSYAEVLARRKERRKEIVTTIREQLIDATSAVDHFDMLLRDAEQQHSDAQEMKARCEGGKNEIQLARHNRLFLHVDAAHGGGYLTVPALRHSVFDGIELADTITIDGHKSFYCYYPCGGLLIRTTRWARTLAAGRTDYITEETDYKAYGESARFFGELSKDKPDRDGKLIAPDVRLRQRDMDKLRGLQALAGRSLSAARSELTHLPFNQYLEGSRGPQGIMQLYFNLATLGLRGYRSILEWTHLLSKRCEEAISLGMSDLRLATDPPVEGELHATDKMHAIATSNSGCDADSRRDPSGAVPIGGGRFLRLSDGSCNQILMMYVPALEAKLIASGDRLKDERVEQIIRFLWRVNEHLWNAHIYANPTFTYYLGHTTLPLDLPECANDTHAFAQLVQSWNAWLRRGGDGVNPFLLALAEMVKAKEKHAVKLFCHKVVVMHPYTDESLLGDMLRRVAFWGERSVADVRTSDAIADLLR